jgi:putative two-component system response regulator
MTTNASQYTVLFVDDEPDIVATLYRFFRKKYHCLRATSGAEAIEILNQQNVDLLLCDQRMPEITGDQVLAHAYKVQPQNIRILLTGYADFESLVKSVNNGQMYRYIAKPWDHDDLNLTLQQALETLQLKRDLNIAKSQLETSYHNAINMLCVASEGKDEDTASHIQRVRYYTKSLAMASGVKESDAEHMGSMSILHDIGKLFVPDSILKKEGPLNEDEWGIMKKHPEYGVKILGDDEFYQQAKEISYGHHENFDGSGYPQGLKGEDIPLSARIVKLADVFDALTTKRPYKEPWTIEQAIDFIKRKKGIMFDPILVEQILRLHEQGTLSEIKTRFQD